jgi:hypothetical protein
MLPPLAFGAVTSTAVDDQVEQLEHVSANARQRN